MRGGDKRLALPHKGRNKHCHFHSTQLVVLPRVEISIAIFIQHNFFLSHDCLFHFFKVRVLYRPVRMEGGGGSVRDQIAIFIYLNFFLIKKVDIQVYELNKIAIYW